MTSYKIWISYDLGLGEEAAKKNDKQYQQEYQKRHQALMAWLASKKAVECGQSVALYNYTSLHDNYIELLPLLKQQLEKIGLGEKLGVRVYIIITDTIKVNYADGPQNKDTQRILFAGFIVGKRCQAPWEDGPQNRYDNVDIKF